MGEGESDGWVRVRVTGGWRVMGVWEVEYRQPDGEHRDGARDRQVGGG